jgi:hypothetical protein
MSHAPGTARTCNLQFRRLSLYPVELRVLFAEPLTIGRNPALARGKLAADFQVNAYYMRDGALDERLLPLAD